MSDLPNLCELLDKGLEKFDTRRGDEEKAHASDLGKCLLQVWSRRNGQPQLAFSPKTRARLQAGLRDEEWIYQRILAGVKGTGWKIERSPELPADSDLVGHLDFVLSAKVLGGFFKLVVDVKMTEWREVWEETGDFYPDTHRAIKAKSYIPYDDAPGRMAMLQALTYARSIVNPDGKHAPFAIFQGCRRSNLFTQFPSPGAWYDADDVDLVTEWQHEKNEMLTKTGPGVDPIKAGIAMPDLFGNLMGEPPIDTYNAKGSSWLCAYCQFYGCSRNVNKDGDVIS
jgi:hypothetical protein